MLTWLVVSMVAMILGGPFWVFGAWVYYATEYKQSVWLMRIGLCIAALGKWALFGGMFSLLLVGITALIRLFT